MPEGQTFIDLRIHFDRPLAWLAGAERAFAEQVQGMLLTTGDGDDPRWGWVSARVESVIAATPSRHDQPTEVSRMSQDHDAPQLGCYVDSHHGHYAIPAAIKVAQDLGFSVDPFAQWALDTYDELNHEDDFPHEALHELCDEAEAWLNLNRAPDGALWGWSDGDFGLYAEEGD